MLQVPNAHKHEFDFYKCDRPRLLLTEDTCATVERQDYLLKYTFRFPNEENAKFSLGFDCDIYHGEIHIQSEYFTRKNQSDLPVGFAQNGLEIVDYSSILKKARKKDPRAVSYGGELALDRDALYWVFSAVIPINNPDGDAEMGVQHTVYLDPYTGKVVSHGVRAY